MQTEKKITVTIPEEIFARPYFNSSVVKKG